MTVKKNPVNTYRGYYVVQDQPEGRWSIVTRNHEYIDSAADMDEAKKIIDDWKAAL